MSISKQIKEMVSNDKKVKFNFYRNKELWYKTECGFSFPVPTSDTGDAAFLGEDRAILFMRYIRKQMENIQSARYDQELKKDLT